MTDSTWTEHFTVTNADWFTETSPYQITGDTITLLGNHKKTWPEGFASTSTYTYTLTADGLVLRAIIYNQVFYFRFKIR